MVKAWRSTWVCSGKKCVLDDFLAHNGLLIHRFMLEIGGPGGCML